MSDLSETVASALNDQAEEAVALAASLARGEPETIRGLAAQAIAQAVVISIQDAVAHLQRVQTVALARAAGGTDAAGGDAAGGDLRAAEEHLERVGRIGTDLLARLFPAGDGPFAAPARRTDKQEDD